MFAEELFSLVPDELGSLEDKDKPEAKVCVCMVNVGAVSMGLFFYFIFKVNEVCSPSPQVRVIPLELQRLFAHLLLVDQQSASTAGLTDSFGWNSSEVCALYLLHGGGESEA